MKLRSKLQRAQIFMVKEIVYVVPPLPSLWGHLEAPQPSALITGGAQGSYPAGRARLRASRLLLLGPRKTWHPTLSHNLFHVREMLLGCSGRSFGVQG